MASGSSLSSMLLFGNSNEEDQPQTVALKKRRNLLGVQYPDAEVIALSPTTLMAKNRFVCEVCDKGFPRDQNLQLHKRGHNLPWKLKQKSTSNDQVKRKVYLCPEPSCINHEPSHALGDLTGIKKHYSRKHCEKKYKCRKCEKMYAVKSDLKAHSKTCGTKEYKCHCGTIFSRRDSFINHRAFCDAVLVEGISTKSPIGENLFKIIENHNPPTPINTKFPNLGSQMLANNNFEIAQGVSQLCQKSYKNVTVKTSMDLNYYKSPATLLPSSHEITQHKHQGNFDTRNIFTNLVNNTTSQHKNMQLYNLNFMGSGDQGSSFISGGSSLVTHNSTSLYLSSYTGSMPQISATGLLQKAFTFGSMSSTNFLKGNSTSSSSNDQYISGVTNDHMEISQGGLARGNNCYEDEWKIINSREQQPPQNSSFNIAFEQFSGVKTTRDFLGVGVDIVSNTSNDEPKSTITTKSFL